MWSKDAKERFLGTGSLSAWMTACGRWVGYEVLKEKKRLVVDSELTEKQACARYRVQGPLRERTSAMIRNILEELTIVARNGKTEKQRDRDLETVEAMRAIMSDESEDPEILIQNAARHVGLSVAALKARLRDGKLAKQFQALLAAKGIRG